MKAVCIQSKEVIGTFNNKKKIGNNSGATKSTDQFLRLLRSDTSFQASLVSLENKDQEDTYSEAQKEARNAMLEADYQKAKAHMTMQQRPNFY